MVAIGLFGEEKPLFWKREKENSFMISFSACIKQ